MSVYEAFVYIDFWCFSWVLKLENYVIKCILEVSVFTVMLFDLAYHVV